MMTRASFRDAAVSLAFSTFRFYFAAQYRASAQMIGAHNMGGCRLFSILQDVAYAAFSPVASHSAGGMAAPARYRHGASAICISTRPISRRLISCMRRILAIAALRRAAFLAARLLDELIECASP